MEHETLENLVLDNRDAGLFRVHRSVFEINAWALAPRDERAGHGRARPQARRDGVDRDAHLQLEQVLRVVPTVTAETR